jgi:hypothetical protein
MNCSIRPRHEIKLLKHMNIHLQVDEPKMTKRGQLGIAKRLSSNFDAVVRQP